jgi:Ni,Fe-hydrogenase maturation factor
MAACKSIIKQTVKYPNYNLICHLIVYSIPEEDQYVGIFVDITNMQQSQAKLKELKTETIIQAQELIQHQIEMAQLLAKHLGESTAKGELLMQKLIEAIDK